MDYQEAIEALKLEGISFGGKPRRIANFCGALDAAVSAMQELQQYKQIGTLEEVREAVETIKRYETQYPDDMRNPLEPLKVSSALKSEIMKLELRKKSKPESISMLDYTIIAALKSVLERTE